MRRRNRKPINEDKETKKIVYISIAVLIIAILAFVITFFVYSNILNKKAKDFTMTTITDLAKQSNEQSEETSSQIGKSVNEVAEENTINKIAINTSAMEGKSNSNSTIEQSNNIKEDNTQKVSTTQKETTKEEKVPDPTFIKPVEGEIIKEFANENLVYSNTLKEWVTHNGIDIKAEKTTVVKASADGTIKSIKNDPRYGITVVIEHVNGYSTIYSNLLTAEFVKEGEKVKQGQTIGTVGNTATFEIADETHLHFEILKDDLYVDPNLYIK